MKSLLLCLALVLGGNIFTSTTVFAVDPKIFTSDKIQEIWPELWKMGAREMKAPTIDPLSEQQVVKEMAGKWFIMSGVIRMDKILISVETNRQVTVSGTKDGKAWEADGQWRVVSNKLVLFVKSANELPDFIFRIKGKPYMFDPWSGALMSELKRENPPVATVKAGDSNIVHNGEARQSSPDPTRKQAEEAKAYFKDYLAKCGTNEIRCLWFLDNNPKVGLVMTINLNEESVSTVRDVYSFALQSLETRKLSHSQILNLEKIITSLPAPDKNADFNRSVFVSIWNGKAVEVFQYDRQHAPGIVQRIYDIGGGHLN